MISLSELKTVLNVNPFETWAYVHRRVMQLVYVYFIVCFADKQCIAFYKMNKTSKSQTHLLRLVLDYSCNKFKSIAIVTHLYLIIKFMGTILIWLIDQLENNSEFL